MVLDIIVAIILILAILVWILIEKVEVLTKEVRELEPVKVEQEE